MTSSLLIVDDEPAFRHGLQALLRASDRYTLLGEAATGAEAVLMASALQPDVILMDLNMPELNGIEATRTITMASPHIGVLILTMFEDDDSVFAAMRAGARGYLLKGALKADLLRAIDAVASGEVIIGAPLATRMVRYFSSMQATQPALAFPALTERERDVLSLIAQGVSNPDIARQLVLSGKTVRNYISNIFAKLQVVDRAEAIIKARNAGMG